MRAINNINGKRIIAMLLLFLLVVELVRGNVGTFFVVDGSSMFPTLKPDDVVRAGSPHGALQRGDVTILTDGRGDKVVKRVVGLPGETITIYRGFVYIDRQRLSEPYLLPRTYTFNSNPYNERPKVWHLKATQYFVLGDNRFESYDSRYFGPVERDHIRAVVSLPENSARPDFGQIVISESGKGRPAVSGQGHSNSHLPLAPTKS